MHLLHLAHKSVYLLFVSLHIVDMIFYVRVHCDTLEWQPHFAAVNPHSSCHRSIDPLRIHSTVTVEVSWSPPLCLRSLRCTMPYGTGKQPGGNSLQLRENCYIWQEVFVTFLRIKNCHFFVCDTEKKVLPSHWIRDLHKNSIWREKYFTQYFFYDMLTRSYN